MRAEKKHHNTADHKEGEQLEDRRNVGENSCNSGDGTDQTGPILCVNDDECGKCEDFCEKGSFFMHFN